MALQVVSGQRLPYMWELSYSPDWPDLVTYLWRACSAAHSYVVSLEELRALHGGIKSAMLERRIDTATAEWLAVESYARPLVEALGQ